MPKKLTQYGCPTEWGCPACGVRGKKWGNMKSHMYECCPEYFDKYSMGDLRNWYCNLAAGRCIVPGHEDWREEKRKEIQERKKVKQQNKKPGWNKHKAKLNGGDYDRSASIGLSEEIEGILRPLIEAEFDEYPDGPYGVQEAMGSREDWIHWGLRLAAHPCQILIVMDEYQKDIQLHIQNLNTLGDVLQQGYQGCFAYIQALHCIFQDAFLRCSLPLPPLLDLEHAMRIRGEDVKFKNRMRSFRGYKFRAFGIVEVVTKNIIHLYSDEHLPPFEAAPPFHRRVLNNNIPQRKPQLIYDHASGSFVPRGADFT